MKIGRFLSDLGSEKGAPGGGAAAALTGALGASLIEMVARLNDKRHKTSSGNFKKAAKLRVKLQQLVRRDAQAFQGIQKAYKSREERPGLWQASLKKGALIPLAICEACASAAELARNEKNRTSSWLESDRLEALVLLKAAFDSGVLNVEINLKHTDDSVFVRNSRDKIKALTFHAR